MDVEVVAMTDQTGHTRLRDFIIVVLVIVKHLFLLSLSDRVDLCV
jgi:hypothetical protein